MLDLLGKCIIDRIFGDYLSCLKIVYIQNAFMYTTTIICKIIIVPNF